MLIMASVGRSGWQVEPFTQIPSKFSPSLFSAAAVQRRGHFAGLSKTVSELSWSFVKITNKSHPSQDGLSRED